MRRFFQCVARLSVGIAVDVRAVQGKQRVPCVLRHGNIRGGLWGNLGSNSPGQTDKIQKRVERTKRSPLAISSGKV